MILIINSFILFTAISRISALPIDHSYSNNHNTPFNSANPWDPANGNFDQGFGGEGSNPFGNDRFNNNNDNINTPFGNDNLFDNSNSNTNSNSGRIGGVGFPNTNSGSNGGFNPNTGNSNPNEIIQPGGLGNGNSNSIGNAVGNAGGSGLNGNSNGNAVGSGFNGNFGSTPNSGAFNGNGNFGNGNNIGNAGTSGNSASNGLNSNGQPSINPFTGQPINNNPFGTNPGSNALPVVSITSLFPTSITTTTSSTRATTSTTSTSLPFFTAIITPPNAVTQNSESPSNLPLILGLTIGSILLLGALIVIFMALLHYHKKGQHKLNQTPEYQYGKDGKLRNEPLDAYRTQEEFDSQSGMIQRDGMPPVFVEEGGVLVSVKNRSDTFTPDTNHARFSSSETFDDVQRRNSLQSEGVLIAPIPVRSKTVSFSGVVQTRRDLYADDDDMYQTAAKFGQSAMVMPIATSTPDYEAQGSDEEHVDALGFERTRNDNDNAFGVEDRSVDDRSKIHSSSPGSLTNISGLRDSKSSTEALGSNAKYEIVTSIK